MKSSSLQMLDAGIPNPREYRDALIHDWDLRPDFQDHLQTYILRETPVESLFFHLKDGELLVAGKMYSVIWANSPDKVRDSKDALISLRYCKFLQRGYALVKVLQGNGKWERLEY